LNTLDPEIAFMETTPAPVFTWSVQPLAAEKIAHWVAYFLEHSQFTRNLQSELYYQTGTRLTDWIDHLALPTEIQRDESTNGATAGKSSASLQESLVQSGFTAMHDSRWFRHEKGIFPEIEIVEGQRMRMCLKVESVPQFLLAHQLLDVPIEGEPFADLRRAKVSEDGPTELWIVERHGVTQWQPTLVTADRAKHVAMHYEALLLRNRLANGFEIAADLIKQATTDLGVDRACDLFFAAERAYWQSRNRAARMQKMRQDKLGMGWANHDHHTYRSSRESFASLIACLQLLGMECRERFYAGEQAGWGAQVLEQPRCGIVVFADVDLQPDEVVGDFARTGLAAADQLGTVGLWCKLHGEAFLEAGMHHLECQFDFDAAREQLDALGVGSMAPFTDFEHLKQAFTVPEIWQVKPERVEQALRAGWIDETQAAKFLEQGVVGSHLEILERNDGYKGFNQTGISHIIKQTDPRIQNA
jgi:hypothetical protein